MAVTLKEVEAIPASYPSQPSGLSTEAQALDEDMLWQRIESYCRVRWTDREVVWTVEGEGEWEAPLSPVTLTSVEIWESNAWTACAPLASAWGGYDFAGDGPYRITADVGGGNVPAAVNEAYRRLAEYLADDGNDRSGASRYSVSLGGAIEESYDRTAAWKARALQLSGAADLLRPYRRRA